MPPAGWRRLHRYLYARSVRYARAINRKKTELYGLTDYDLFPKEMAEKYRADDDRLIGYQGKFIGEGTLRRGGDPATVALTDSREEAVPGDRLVPEAVDIPLNFYPRAPSSAIDGRIISVVGGVTQIGQYQVVVLNRGTQDGLAVGDVLTVFRTGETVDDRFGGGKVRLPDEEAGTLMVFKVYDRIGYGLVMEATQAIHIHDSVRNPI